MIRKAENTSRNFSNGKRLLQLFPSLSTIAGNSWLTWIVGFYFDVAIWQIIIWVFLEKFCSRHSIVLTKLNFIPRFQFYNSDCIQSYKFLINFCVLVILLFFRLVFKFLKLSMILIERHLNLTAIVFC